MLRIIAILFCFLTTASFAQSKEDACKGFEHHQLDFLMGEWIAYDSLGKKKAHHSIQRLAGTCVIQDEWRGTTSSGTGYFYFEKEDSTWRQVWIKDAGVTIEYVGQFDRDELLMVSLPLEDEPNTWYILSILSLPSSQVAVKRTQRNTDGSFTLVESHVYRRLTN